MEIKREADIRGEQTENIKLCCGVLWWTLIFNSDILSDSQRETEIQQKVGKTRTRRQRDI